MLVVKKASKEAAKSLGIRFPDSAINALDQKITDMIKMAADRAKKNGRVTLREYDF